MQFPTFQNTNFSTFPTHAYENSELNLHFSNLQQTNYILLQKNISL